MPIATMATTKHQADSPDSACVTTGASRCALFRPTKATKPHRNNGSEGRRRGWPMSWSLGRPQASTQRRLTSLTIPSGVRTARVMIRRSHSGLAEADAGVRRSAPPRPQRFELRHRDEVALARSTAWALPPLGQLVERGARRYGAGRVARRGVVDIPAERAGPAAHEISGPPERLAPSGTKSPAGLGRANPSARIHLTVVKPKSGSRGSWLSRTKRGAWW